MKIDCGKRGRYRKYMAIRRARHWWHPWFAWFPIRVGEHDCRWLETVQRKGKYWSHWDGSGWSWKYKGME